MNTQHTPTPWHVQPIGSRRYVEADGPKLVCDMQRDECLDEGEIAECDANAEFIVRACNCHSELLAACQAQHQAIDRLFALLIEADDSFMPTESGQPWLAVVQGNEAINKAEGKP